MDIKQKRIDEINKGGLIRPISHEMNRTIGMELTDGQKAMQENKRLKKRIEELKQRLEAGQHETIVMLQKSLKDEFERVDEVAKSVKGEVDEQFYRGMRSGLKKALALLEMHKAT